MDPVIFSIDLGGFTFALRWYGVLVMLGVAAAAWLAEREVSRRGENGEHIWNALVYLLPVGVIGARLWYVANATLGGSNYYLENPGKILAVWEGGLHFYGGLLFGALAMAWYVNKYKMDFWLLLDSVAPLTLLGQALARPANFINQELYGQPTTLPWGIPIDAEHRIGEYRDLAAYPVESTRFHPAFAYEMLWNFLAVGLILWLTRRHPQFNKPGTAFGLWLFLAGVGRTIIEFFRPDQPRIPGTEVTYTMLVSILMALAGLVFLLARFGKISLPWLKLGEKYTIAPPVKLN